MTPDQSLAAAVVAIYVLLTPPVLYIAFRHGVKGGALLGWGYLFLFCTIKMVGAGLQLPDKPTTGASIVASIGLSPLLLSAAGVLHEGKTHHDPKADHIRTLGFHILVIGGTVLVAIGSSRLSHDTDLEKTHKDQNLAKAGVVFLFIGWILLSIMSIVSASTIRRDTGRNSQNNDGTRLVLAVLLAIPFIGIRAIASLASITGGNPDISAATGTLGAKVGLYIIEELAATLVLIGAGIRTINIRSQRTKYDGVNLTVH
ncbi:hypothetical protein GQ53DRAFT_855258 [Thozetella sp. PMI_491]|nr:hypothetical protein GQ53DRAFT_855258 [Thozetella sp. PMI_491]